MNCKKCGNVLNPTDVICPACGEPVNPPAPLTSTVASEAVATPIASTDIAVNPNVVLEDLVKDAPSPVSAVGTVASNEQVATPMANTDIAVNPSVVVENVETPAPPMPSAVGATEVQAASMDPNAVMQTPQAPNMGNPTNVVAPQAPAVAAATPAQNVPEAKPKKKLDIKFIIIVVALVILIIGLGALIIFKLPK